MTVKVFLPMAPGDEGSRGIKRSSLFVRSMSDDEKSFGIGTRGLYHKTYYGRNLRFL
jgi:hypothetical protein